MTRVWDCTDLQRRPARITAAAAALGRGQTAVVPDEGVYSLICDAFSDKGVAAVRLVKGRSQQPLTVLVGRKGTVDGVAGAIPAYARDLMAAFWPGPLTLLLRQQPSLAWPLRATGIAVRMPLHPVMLALVRELGPTAATTANAAGMSPVTTPQEFHDQLSGEVDLLLDGGPIPAAERSTVVDATAAVPVIRRPGGFSAERLAAVCPELVAPEEG